MSIRSLASRIARPVFVAGLLSVAATAAFAQDGGAPYGGGPVDTVIVTGPRVRVDNVPLNAPPGRMSLSTPVAYTTRDLVDPERAQVLRWRVWRTAHDVCVRLRDIYPVYRMSTAPTCFREAYENAISKIDARIAGARMAYWYGY